ncbi:hypothetical protein [Sediminispirochaeta smaragdinae]|uniref:Phage gp6-like head-tail connector protein n=1 Tax=Sediminispirochaeta smaragdinae (strain DSM 11293 / JCM 15392 / SEBR 4228) TaxID=573413 RepID=E1R3H6_SEDSS|nr:hypothetical protein [Sediminispirochaeta smaragdinae]ADK81607.1 hypothetical protein Spirs_2494 [Sediminispirochaeta smaragdinae DSM 11293]
MNNLTTWEAVKKRLDLEESQENEAESLIAVASRRAETYTSRKLSADDHVVILSGTGSRTLQLPQYPILSVTGVWFDTYGVFDTGTELTEYTRDDETGRLFRRSCWVRGFRNIKVSYRAGYEEGSIPEDLEESVIQLVGYWLGSQGISWLDKGNALSGEYQTMYVGVMDLPFQVRNVWDAYREVSV